MFSSITHHHDVRLGPYILLRNQRIPCDTPRVRAGLKPEAPASYQQLRATARKGGRTTFPSFPEFKTLTSDGWSQHQIQEVRLAADCSVFTLTPCKSHPC